MRRRKIIGGWQNKVDGENEDGEEQEADQEDEESDVEEELGVDDVDNVEDFEDVDNVEDVLKLGKGEYLRRMRWGLDVDPTKGATVSSEEKSSIVMTMTMSSRS